MILYKLRDKETEGDLSEIIVLAETELDAIEKANKLRPSVKFEAFFLFDTDDYDSYDFFTGKSYNTWELV